jgi:hypothetical protein
MAAASVVQCRLDFRLFVVVPGVLCLNRSLEPGRLSLSMVMRILRLIGSLVLAYQLCLTGMLSAEKWHSFGEGLFWQAPVCVIAAFLGVWKRAPKWLCVLLALVNPLILLYASNVNDVYARGYIRRQLSEWPTLAGFFLIVGLANSFCVWNCLGGRSLDSRKLTLLCIAIMAIFALSMLSLRA